MNFEIKLSFLFEKIYGVLIYKNPNMILSGYPVAINSMTYHSLSHLSWVWRQYPFPKWISKRSFSHIFSSWGNSFRDTNRSRRPPTFFHMEGRHIQIFI